MNRPVARVSIVAAALAAALLPGIAPAAWDWTQLVGLAEVYLHPATQGATDHRVLVVVGDRNFHTCGWNSAANLSTAVVGDAQFKAAVSVVLTASATNRPVKLLVDGCDGDRAKAYGVMLGR